MSNGRRDVPPTSSRREGVRPRSPAEALEPGRAPARPRGIKTRSESRAISGLVRVVSGVLTLALVVMLSFGALTLFVRHLYEKPGPLTVAQTVVIPKGASSSDIAERLEREGIISSRWAFMLNYLVQSRLSGKETMLRHGEYLFRQSASIHEVIDTLSDGKAVLYKVMVPEGLTSQQIVDRLRSEENLTGEVTQIPAEGSLMPDTYSIEKGTTRVELLQRMQAKQKQVLEQAWERRHPDTPLKQPQDAVTLASIVEKETGRSDERERIAGVFTNRLLKNMPLQSDPTILYGVYGGAVQWGKPIMQTEKDAKNGHNTYQMRGLPQTPICNPGRPAIEAAVNPAKTGDLYFVADGNGGHIFTTNLKDHNAAVENWRKVEREIRAKQAAKADGQAADGTAAGDAIPNPPATQGEAPALDAKGETKSETPSAAAEPPAPAASAAPQAGAPAAQQASSVPLPVRKPKK